jgi:HAD superfamily hydrolase (TIGR01509 family)
MRPTDLAIIFDVEGTLADCIPQTLESWRQALSECGHPFTREELQPYSGMDGGDMLRSLLPTIDQDTSQQLIQRQGELYREQYLHHIQPFPGVREVFEALRKVGIPLALATTCKHDELRTYDRRMSVMRLADAVVCGDEVDHGKPHPDLFRAALRKLQIDDPSKAVAIGDTPYDVKAALALGLEPMGVLTGGFSRQALQEAGCTCVVDRAGAVVPIMVSRLVTGEGARSRGSDLADGPSANFR